MVSKGWGESVQCLAYVIKSHQLFHKYNIFFCYYMYFLAMLAAGKKNKQLHSCYHDHSIASHSVFHNFF